MDGPGTASAGLEGSEQSQDVQSSEDNETNQSHVFTFNVGGTRFETLRTTLQDSFLIHKLDDLSFRSANGILHDPKLQEYFLDRDPEAFRCVLNYARSGVGGQQYKLHMPSTVCGPQVEEELTFWGVPYKDIQQAVQPCCWGQLRDLRQLKKVLEDFRILDTEEEKTGCRAILWKVLTKPAESRTAKRYGWLSLFFALLAIVSFCLSTHPTFRVPQSQTSPSDVKAASENGVTGVTSDLQSSIPSTSPRTAEETVWGTQMHQSLSGVDFVCLLFFCVEYALKLSCAPRRLQFLISFFGVVDLLAILPDLVELILMTAAPDVVASDPQLLLFVPFLRLMRVSRLFRLIHHFSGLWVMVYTLRASYKDLFLMLVFLLAGTVLFASVIFFVDDREVFTSIPAGFWWAVVTMTTVGYGDMYPVTTWGKVIGSMTTVCGVLVIGFSIPTLVNNFLDYYQHVQLQDKFRVMLAQEGEVRERVKVKGVKEMEVNERLKVKQAREGDDGEHVKFKESQGRKQNNAKRTDHRDSKCKDKSIKLAQEVPTVNVEKEKYTLTNGIVH